MTITGAAPARKARARTAAFSILTGLFVYVFAEFLFSTAFIVGWLYPPPSTWFFETSGKTLRFDARAGYKLTSTPSRFTRITFGEPEYTGILRGNNRGYPDQHDFIPEREADGRQRVAVFGDSFTAAQYLDKNWPDRVEELDAGLQLLNFSQDGVGLANWWSILKREVEAENFELDAVVFAVYRGNLQRRFAVADHRDQNFHMFGRTHSWDPATWPGTRAEAQKFMRPLNGYIVAADAYEAALSGRWHPELPRPIRPYLLAWIKLQMEDLLDSGDSRSPGAASAGQSETDRARLVAEIAAILKRRGVPVLVAHVPERARLLANDWEIPAETLAFAERLDAAIFDGSHALRSETERSLRQQWFPYDAHWNQRGSDRFAASIQAAIARL
ncbi:MAG: hypothetical protein AAF458_01220 [Pseudomonadota bacterium]